MVVLNVTYYAKPGQREAFVRALEEAGILDQVRSENGCLQYEYFGALDNPDQLLLIEHWADQQALDIHQSMPHMAQLRAIKSQHVLDTKLERFHT